MGAIPFVMCFWFTRTETHLITLDGSLYFLKPSSDTNQIPKDLNL